MLPRVVVIHEPDVAVGVGDGADDLPGGGGGGVEAAPGRLQQGEQLPGPGGEGGGAGHGGGAQLGAGEDSPAEGDRLLHVGLGHAAVPGPGLVADPGVVASTLQQRGQLVRPHQELQVTLLQKPVNIGLTLALTTDPDN